MYSVVRSRLKCQPLAVTPILFLQFGVCACATTLAMATVALIIKELEHSDKLCHEQVKLGADMAETSSELVNDAINKIKRLKNITTEEATQLTTAAGSGPWDNASKLKLANAIKSRKLGAAACDAESRGNQDTAIELFLTDEQWEKIDDQSYPMSAKIALMKSILCRIGVLLPSEVMKGRIANLLRHRGIPYVSHDYYLCGLIHSTKRDSRCVSTHIHRITDIWYT